MPVNAPPTTLARMALAVGTPADWLDGHGVVDVANEMRAMRVKVHGRGVALDGDRYQTAHDALEEWLEDSDEMHPPREALWLWTPRQLAENLAEQVALLETVYEHESRAHVQASMRGKASPSQEDGGEHGSAATT